MVAGCEEGSCHFISGNLRAKKRVLYAKKLLDETGVNPERLEMFHIAASQGPLFAQRSAEFTKKIRRLNLEKSGEEKTESCCQINAEDNGKHMDKINDSC